MTSSSKILSALLFASAVLVAPASVSARTTGDGGHDVKRLSSEGFAACRALGDSGYTGIATGIISGTSSRTGESAFRVRVCFRTASQCQRFISRIRHHISDVQTIRYTNCSPRG